MKNNLIIFKLCGLKESQRNYLYILQWTGLICKDAYRIFNSF